MVGGLTYMGIDFFFCVHWWATWNSAMMVRSKIAEASYDRDIAKTFTPLKINGWNLKIRTQSKRKIV